MPSLLVPSLAQRTTTEHTQPTQRLTLCTHIILRLPGSFRSRACFRFGHS
jgi:hypothetical protein